jgi:HPt (histidine-containing phosphotransfer) domain-containing protein
VSRGNPAFVKRMVDVFCDQTPETLAAMIAAYQASDLMLMAEMAHRIKPSIDNLKIWSLKQLIRDVEKMGSGEMPIGNLSEALIEIERVLNQVIDELRQAYPAVK